MSAGRSGPASAASPPQIDVLVLAETDATKRINGSSSVNHSPVEIPEGLYAEATATAADPAWQQVPPGSLLEWERFASYPNYLVAHIVAGRLKLEGVPTFIECIGILPDGTSRATIWVIKKLAHRARFVLAWPPTDSELLFLATGELLHEDPQI